MNKTQQNNLLLLDAWIHGKIKNNVTVRIKKKNPIDNTITVETLKK